MVDREESRLKAMDLTKLSEHDYVINQDDDWDLRRDIHNELKHSTLVTQKPNGSFFEFEENTIDKDYLSCHLMIPVVVSKTRPKVSDSAFLESDASIDYSEEESEELEDNTLHTPEEIAAAKNLEEAAKKTTNKEKIKTFASSGVKSTIDSGPSKKKDDPRTELRAEYDWAMEEAAAWNKEHMRYDELKHKNKFQTFRYASEPDTYPVPDYFEYLPSHVKNAEMKYKQKVFDKHIGTYEQLEMADIEITYRMIKCNMPLYDDQKMQRHYKNVHLLPNGYASLKKRESIKINTDLEFKFEDLKHFQNVSQDMQHNLIDKIYTISIATGVVSERSGKRNARINKSRSLDFMKEMEKVCEENYYDRFKFVLRSTINQEVNTEFECTWQSLEDSMTEAVGKENEVKRIYEFNKIKSSDFHSKPLDIIVTDIDCKIDESLGRSIESHTDELGRVASLYSYSTYYKYNLILGVVENLDGEFSQLKEYIEQKITQMFNDCRSLIDLAAFRTAVIDELSSKNGIKIFKSKDVPNPSITKPSVNETKVEKKKKKEASTVNSEYRKKKKPQLEDLETAKELVKVFIDKTNETNKNNWVLKDPEVVKILGEKKWRLCGTCMSSNCQLMQYLCSTNKVPKKFLGSCKGKPTKLGELPEMLKNIDTRIANAKKNAKQVNTTSVKPNIENHSKNSAAENFFLANPDLLDKDSSTRQTKSNTATFTLELANLLTITEESLPKWKKIKKFKKHKCLICGKRNLSLIRYDDHMTCYHDVCLQKPVLEEYQIARSNWIVDREQANQAELETITCDYDSELEMRYSDMESENDSGTDDNTSDSSEDDSDNSSRTDSSPESEEDQSSTESDSSSESEEQPKPRTVNSPPGDLFDKLEEELEGVYEMGNALEDKFKGRTRYLNKLEEDLTNLNTSLKKNKEDSAQRKPLVQKLLSAKSDTDSTNTCETLIKTLDNMIQKETDERIKFTKRIEERFSNLKCEIEAERLKLANPIITHDLEVAVNAKTQIEDKHDKNTPSSVVNYEQKLKPETDIHQLSTTSTEVKSEVKINHNNLKLVNSIEMETSKIKTEEIPHIEDVNENATNDTPELEDEKEHDEEIEEFNAGQFFIENFFKLLTLVTIQTFKILNMAVDLNLGWGLLIIFFFLVNSAKAAPMGNEISETLEINATKTGPFSYMNEGMTTVVYGATAAITKNYILPLGNVEERITEDISDSCDAIATQDNICEKDVASCPMVHLNKENYGNSIRKSFQTFSALGMACETSRRGTSSEAIKLCISGKSWILPKNATEAFSFLHMMQTGYDHDYISYEMDMIHASLRKRSLHSGPIKLQKGSHKELVWNLFWQELSMKGSNSSIHSSPDSMEQALSRSKRIVVSGPILFALIMGVLTTTASAAVSHVVAVNEANKVMTAEALHREDDIENAIANNFILLNKINNQSISVDRLRHVTTHSSNSFTHLMDSADFNNRINHWMSKDKTIQYSDPALEEFSEDIRSMVLEDTKGMIDSDIESMVRLVSNTATMVTTIIPRAGHSDKCSNKLLMKTLHVTLVNHRTRTTIIKVNGRFYPDTGDRSKYLLIPQDGILSKSAELFSKEMHVVGRTCWADQSINATAGTTSNPLFQTFTLQIPKNMTIEESCPLNDTWISRTWTVTTFTKLELPITCKIKSAKFNCSAMTLLSSETKEVQFQHHRMKILEQHWNEEANNLNETKFYRSNVTLELTTTSFPSIKTDYSNLKIPLIFVGGIAAVIPLACLVIKLTACKKNDNPTKPVNVIFNTTNSANNENNATNSANNENNAANQFNKTDEGPTAPITIPPFRTLEEILNMKPSQRTEEEKRRVLEYQWEQKEKENNEDPISDNEEFKDNPFQL